MHFWFFISDLIWSRWPEESAYGWRKDHTVWNISLQMTAHHYSSNSYIISRRSEETYLESLLNRIVIISFWLFITRRRFKNQIPASSFCKVELASVPSCSQIKNELNRFNLKTTRSDWTCQLEFQNCCITNS